MPSPGGQISGIADTSAQPGFGGGWQGGASRRSPLRAATRRPRGRVPRGRRRSRQGLPLGRRVVGLTPDRRDAPQLPARKIITGCPALKGTTTPHHAIARADTEQPPTRADGRSRRSATADPDSGGSVLTTSTATSTATDGWQRPWVRTEASCWSAARSLGSSHTLQYTVRTSRSTSPNQSGKPLGSMNTPPTPNVITAGGCMPNSRSPHARPGVRCGCSTASNPKAPGTP